VYDFTNKEWKIITAAPIGSPGRCVCFAFAAGSKVVLWGGWNGYEDDPKFLPDGALYDLQKDAWTKIPDVPASVPMQLHPGW